MTPHRPQYNHNVSFSNFILDFTGNARAFVVLDHCAKEVIYSLRDFGGEKTSPAFSIIRISWMKFG